MAKSCDCGAHEEKPPLNELVTFPCDYIFKAFGPNDAAFVASVRAAIGKTVNVPEGSTKVRASSQGEHQCVSVVVPLQTSAELQVIYSELQQIAGLKYLL
jgi:putative lipoic acid-binding regulatory protein